MNTPDQPISPFTPGEPFRPVVRTHDPADQAQRLRVLVDTLAQRSVHTAHITVVDTRSRGAADSIYSPGSYAPGTYPPGSSPAESRSAGHAESDVAMSPNGAPASEPGSDLLPLVPLVGPRSVKIVEDRPSRLHNVVTLEHVSPGRGVPIAAAGSAASSSSPSAPHVQTRPRLARVLTIASGKGGVGKTNLSVNLSIALARAGLRVTLIDADVGVANADVLCGLNPAARLDLALADAGHRPSRTLADLAVDAPGGFRLVPGAVAGRRPADADPAQRHRLADGFNQFDGSADLLVVDAPAGVGPTVMTCLHAADRIVVVATPEPTSIADAYALIKSFHLANADRRDTGGAASPASAHAQVSPDVAGDLRVQLVVNSAADAREAHAVHQRIESVARRFLGRRVLLAGWIPADAQVSRAVRARAPLLLASPASSAARAIEHLAGDMLPALGLRTLPAGFTQVGAARPRSFVRRLLGLD